METAVDALLADRKTAVAAARLIDEPFLPKAIYVCTTNTVDGIPISEDVSHLD
jgi:type III restriction enzyme